MTPEEARRHIDPEFLKFVEEGRRLGFLETEASAAATAAELTVAISVTPKVNGSVQRRCAACGRPAWAAPETEAMLRARGDKPTRIICWNCFADEAKRDHGIDLPKDR